MKFLGICEHRRLEAQMSFAAGSDGGGAPSGQHAALRARGSARPWRGAGREAQGHGAITPAQPMAASNSQTKPQETCPH